MDRVLGMWISSDIVVLSQFCCCVVLLTLIVIDFFEFTFTVCFILFVGDFNANVNFYWASLLTENWIFFKMGLCLSLNIIFLGCINLHWYYPLFMIMFEPFSKSCFCSDHSPVTTVHAVKFKKHVVCFSKSDPLLSNN